PSDRYAHQAVDRLGINAGGALDDVADEVDLVVPVRRGVDARLVRADVARHDDHGGAVVGVGIDAIGGGRGDVALVADRDVRFRAYAIDAVQLRIDVARAFDRHEAATCYVDALARRGRDVAGLFDHAGKRRIVL